MQQAQAASPPCVHAPSPREALPPDSDAVPEPRDCGNQFCCFPPCAPTLSGGHQRPWQAGAGSRSRPLTGSVLACGTPRPQVKVAEHVLTGHKVAIKILNRRKIQQMEMEEKGEPRVGRARED